MVIESSKVVGIFVLALGAQVAAVELTRSEEGATKPAVVDDHAEFADWRIDTAFAMASKSPAVKTFSRAAVREIERLAATESAPDRREFSTAEMIVDRSS